MNLQVQKEAFPLLKGSVKENVGTYVGNIYNYSLDAMSYYEDPIETNRYIPTDFQVVSCATNEIGELLMYFVENGHAEDARHDRDRFYEMDLKRDDVVMEWNQMHYEGGDVSFDYGDDYSSILMNEVRVALDTYHFSYFIDPVHDPATHLFFSIPERAFIGEWVNPPIKEVW